MKKILVCEDEKDAQESLKNILTKKDYEVYTALDGKEAVEKAIDVKPDLILLDIRMPKIDGLEVASEIRKTNKTTKIIFVTAFASPQIEKEASQFNISAYLVKPSDPEYIVKAIIAALNI